MGIVPKLLTALSVATFVTGAGALLMYDGDGGSARPSPRLTRLAHTPTSLAPEVTTTLPATTSVPVPPAQPVRPAKVPADPYAKEPLVEIGTIEIPKIGLNHRIFHGISLRTIDNGPSHWPGTAMPGENGNAVFAGHRVTHSKPFRNIDQLVTGDEVIFTVGGVRTTYSVTGSEIVKPDALRIVDPTPNATATLFACHPPGSARYRIVAYFTLASAPEPGQPALATG